MTKSFKVFFIKTFLLYRHAYLRYPAEQTSRPIYLAKDQYYFMESFMKEGTGGDDLSVGVQIPGGELDLPISKNLFLVPGKIISISQINFPCLIHVYVINL